MSYGPPGAVNWRDSNALPQPVDNQGLCRKGPTPSPFCLLAPCFLLHLSLQASRPVSAGAPSFLQPRGAVCAAQGLGSPCPWLVVCAPGEAGAAWTFASLVPLEVNWNQSRRILVPRLSAQEVLDCTGVFCAGASTQDAYEYFAGRTQTLYLGGVTVASMYPYTSFSGVSTGPPSCQNLQVRSPQARGTAQGAWAHLWHTTRMHVVSLGLLLSGVW